MLLEFLILFFSLSRCQFIYLYPSFCDCCPVVKARGLTKREPSTLRCKPFWSSSIYYCVHYLFFLNQQFITRSAMADRGSHFVTTLNRTKRKRKRKGKEKTRENKTKSKEKNIYTMLQLQQYCKLVQVVFQKGYELEESFSSQSPALVEPSTVVKDVMSCFDWI